MSSNHSVSRDGQRAPAPLVWTTLAIILGILVDRTFAIPIAASLVASSLLLIAHRTIRRRTARSHTRHPTSIAGHCCITISIACLACAWHHCHWYSMSRDHIVRFAGDRPLPCRLRGRIVTGAVLRERQSQFAAEGVETITRFEMRVESIRDGQRWRSATGRCLVDVESDVNAPPPGTSLEILGLLSRPRQARNPGDFDFRRELRGDGIHVLFRCDSPECWREINGDCISFELMASRWRRALRERIRNALHRRLASEDAALASAMLLGNRHEIDDAFRTQFTQTGTSHLLSISGLHLGILAAPWFLLGRSGLLPMRVTLVAAIVFALAFCWLIEFRTPVLRAAILICVFCCAKLLGRPAFHWNTIALAAALVLVVNPSELFASGAQLSFLAVLTMAYFQRPFRRPADPLADLRHAARPWLTRVFVSLLRSAGWSVRLSGLVWLATAPLVAQQFHLLTPIAVLANPVAMIAITLALYATVLSIVADAICSPMGGIFAVPAHLGFAGLRWVLAQGSQVPAAWCWTSGPPSWWLLGFYGAMLVHYGGWTGRVPRRWQLCVLGGWCISGLLPDFQQALLRTGCTSATTARTTFLDVGHGTAVLTQLPSGQVFLYDAGSMGGGEFAVERISRFLWYHRIAHLDAIFVSHADVDHYNGLHELLDRFSVGVVYVEPSMIERRAIPWGATRKKLERLKIPVRSISAGMSWRAPEDPRGPATHLSLSVQHPPPGLITDSDNQRSLVLDLCHGSQHLLLTGDLEGEALEDWLPTRPLQPRILMAPHHGSGLIPIRSVTRQLRPAAVVVSGGWNPRSEEVIARYGADGSLVYHTAKQGAVLVKLQENSWEISGWLSATNVEGVSARHDVTPFRERDRK